MFLFFSTYEEKENRTENVIASTFKDLFVYNGSHWPLGIIFNPKYNSSLQRPALITVHGTNHHGGLLQRVHLPVIVRSPYDTSLVRLTPHAVQIWFEAVGVPPAAFMLLCAVDCLWTVGVGIRGREGFAVMVKD